MDTTKSLVAIAAEKMGLTEQRIEDILSWTEPAVEGGNSNRHGVIENMTQAATRDVNKVLQYYFAAYPKAGSWWIKHPDGLWSVEYINMSKTGGAIKFPWQWDGETRLFKRWQQQEQERQNAAVQFRFGDKVSFLDKDGYRLEGLITGGRKRATVMVGHVKWHVPYTMLKKV